ncbi:hypothetical protein B0H16DRAFT_1551557 [Mycena metata]|uniref:Uncharacterized protein n=1 Tax=Mycena metata TaxID=1033252 RepID=A0AAD7IVA8_9AGAR|nr:hypothetical protein B0H16DRAFT_1551557 [Mycena metata]
MQFLASFVLSAMFMTTAFAQRGVVAARASADAAAPTCTPPLPPLNTWAENRLTPVVTATNATQLADAFAAFLSPDVSITLNGVATSSAAYQATRTKRGFSGTSTIQYLGSIAVPGKTNTSEEGTVCLYFNNIINGTTVTSGMNLVIRPDASMNGSDTRLVQVLDQVLYGL